MTAMPLAEIARKQIEFARNYTLSLIDDIDDSLWFRQPNEGVTHLAWQVAHLATSEYLLTLFRLRGKRPEDELLISKAFLRQYGKRSAPDPDLGNNPSPADIRDVFHRVHDQVLEELPLYSDSDLRSTVIEPYAVFNTKLGSLFFCAHHEMLHAGQIGLLRRLLGKRPVR